MTPQRRPELTRNHVSVSDDSDDREEFDFEEYADDAEDRPSNQTILSLVNQP